MYNLITFNLSLIIGPSDGKFVQFVQRGDEKTKIFPGVPVRQSSFTGAL